MHKSESMPIIDSTPQTDALTERLLAEHEVPEAAKSAVQRVRELEREVTLLRGELAAVPASARRDPGWNVKVAHLLSRIVLFRIAVSAGIEGGKPGHSSGRECGRDLDRNRD